MPPVHSAAHGLSSTSSAVLREYEFILESLLNQHERSQSYGHSGPWRRDCILRVDERNLPEHFGASGLIRRNALLQAAERLAQEGATRLRYERSFGENILREIRLGSAELDIAYGKATQFNFVPLALALQLLKDRAQKLSTQAQTPWMKDFLAKVIHGASVADLGILGMQRERFKKNLHEVLDALSAATALSEGVDTWVRMLSERLFHDSKRLTAIRATVASFLTRADPRWDEFSEDDVLPAYGLRSRPGVIVCAGGAEIKRNGRTYELLDFAPVAHLPGAWAMELADAVFTSQVNTITTIENEYPFLAHVESHGGPQGLVSCREFVIYTAGFPAPPLTQLLVAIAQRCPKIQFRHYGDADLGGLRIWWFLRSRLGRPLSLFRTTAEWLRKEAATGGTPLSDGEVRAIEHLRRHLMAEQFSPDVQDACALLDTLVELRMKVEQVRG